MRKMWEEPSGITANRQEAPRLTAYCLNPFLSMALVPASAEREWMKATDHRFANRCLPLLIANQSGWLLLSAHAVRVSWTGGQSREALRIELLSGEPPCPALSHFGHGILTWHVPYLFRTSPGYNLLVRGPANWPKEGIYPLEGLVESDWAEATFTMNWKMTRHRYPVVFEAGEPIAMLVPQRRGELESFRTEIRNLESDPDVQESYEEWAEDRAWFNSELRRSGSEAQRQGWQKHYFQGYSFQQGRIEEHQTKLKLRDFVEVRDPVIPRPKGSRE